jgi:hypothetical protein
MASSFHTVSFVELDADRVLVVGSSGITSEILSRATGESAASPGAFARNASGHTLAVLDDGSVLVVGGTNNTGTAYADAYRYIETPR